MRYQASIVLPGYNPLKVANAPTIGTATVASGTSVSVTFTAPACIGGGAISTYTVFANCGIKATTGASSPLVVTGLTAGTAYTFKTIATNAYGPSYPSAASNSVTPPTAGQQAYTCSGTYSWVAPSGVTSVSVVAVGGGAAGTPGSYVCCVGYVAGGGGGGGGLGYINSYSVTPGNSYSLVVGARASSNQAGNFSQFVNATTVKGFGGNGAGSAPTGGTYYGTGGGDGGNAGTLANCNGSGGGGAGGYSGKGGNGGGLYSFAGSNAAACSGGAGGGAAYNGSCWGGAGGGGVGILGKGTTGAGGSTSGYPHGGGGGSGGATGGSNTSSGTVAIGGLYGGGGGGSPGTGTQGGQGEQGAVRIIWPGTTRSFPSTCTGNL